MHDEKMGRKRDKVDVDCQFFKWMEQVKDIYDAE